MKFKTTAKAIRQGYSRILSVGYCDMQRLLSSRSPIAYAAGIYGWSFDVYDIGDIVPGACICTGYRPPKGIEPDYDVLREYESRALSENRERLLVEFIKQTLGVKS